MGFSPHQPKFASPQHQTPAGKSVRWFEPLFPVFKVKLITPPPHPHLHPDRTKLILCGIERAVSLRQQPSPGQERALGRCDFLCFSPSLIGEMGLFHQQLVLFFCFNLWALKSEPGLENPWNLKSLGSVPNAGNHARKGIKIANFSFLPWSLSACQGVYIS